MITRPVSVAKACLILGFHLFGPFPYSQAQPVHPGAGQMEQYLPLIANKRVALVANHSSLIGTTHLLDTLLKKGVRIQKVFAPEHGFRGLADAGQWIHDDRDEKTGIPIVSLYGNKYRPTDEQLRDVDVVVFDIQDVGVRFYTYLSTLHYVMEACGANGVPLIVLDRPNPNSFYIDGPVLDTAFRSFVGMHPVPVVYAMTIGEYARMINGEQWLGPGKVCALTVIPCQHYRHGMRVTLPVPPSPNLRSHTAILAYPSLCFFEGTPISVGRGTDKPFLLMGYPTFSGGNVSFTPRSMPGARKPPYEGIQCRGYDLSVLTENFFYEQKGLLMDWLIHMYQTYPNKNEFFTPFFDKLAGNDLLRRQLQSGMTEVPIRASWQEELVRFKALRKLYLLYPDFE